MEKENDLSIRIKNSAKVTYHKCIASPDGDWVIYHCDECDYELRDNLRTGQLIVRNARTEINHSGSYCPTEFCQASEYLN